jgi:hypothetical protein
MRQIYRGTIQFTWRMFEEILTGDLLWWEFILNDPLEAWAKNKFLVSTHSRWRFTNSTQNFHFSCSLSPRFSQFTTLLADDGGRRLIFSSDDFASFSVLFSRL